MENNLRHFSLTRVEKYTKGAFEAEKNWTFGFLFVRGKA